MRIGAGRVEQYRSMRVELANEAAQLDPIPARKPVVQDVKVEVPLSSQAPPIAEVVRADERILFETERRNFPRVFLVFDQKDALSLSVGVHHTFCSLRFFVVSFCDAPCAHSFPSLFRSQRNWRI